jgi:hypothetical protein
MPNAMERFRRHMSLALIVAILASPLPLASADSQGHGNRVATPGAPRQWLVKYMGGPNRLKRGTTVALEITERTILYRDPNSGPDPVLSIPVAAVSDVSDEVIEGSLSEKVFGPGEPDYLDDLGAPCAEWALARIPDISGAVVAGGCLAGSLAVETPYAILASVLSNIPFKDHFLRLSWQANGEDPEVVFKVSGKDHVTLLEELERVTGQGRREEELQGQAARTAIYDAPVTHIEEFDRKTNEARVQQWLTDQCQASSSQKPNWFSPNSIFEVSSLCPPSATGLAQERARLTK